MEIFLVDFTGTFLIRSTTGKEPTKEEISRTIAKLGDDNFAVTSGEFSNLRPYQIGFKDD